MRGISRYRARAVRGSETCLPAVTGLSDPAGFCAGPEDQGSSVSATKVAVRSRSGLVASEWRPGGSATSSRTQTRQLVSEASNRSGLRCFSPPAPGTLGCHFRNPVVLQRPSFLHSGDGTSRVVGIEAGPGRGRPNATCVRLRPSESRAPGRACKGTWRALSR